MIGNRLKLIRQAHALSLQDLSEQLAAETGILLHRSALSGYETGRTYPNATVLEALSRVLGVPVGYFDLPEWSDFSLDYFFCPTVAAQRQQETDAYIQVRLERHHVLDDMLNQRSKWRRPQPRTLRQGEDEVVELLATQLREEWNLGVFPIASVCGLLESIGWYLLMTPNSLNRLELNSTESCGYENSCGMPFILYSSSYFPDELRYQLLKHVGYAYVQGETPQHTQKLAGHFARALLLSHEQAVSEAGIRRDNLTSRELLLLKQKYGIPRRFILYRLFELGIISEACYNRYTAHLRQNLFLQRETIMEHHFTFETPTAYDMKLLHAQTEGLLTSAASGYFDQRDLTFDLR